MKGLLLLLACTGTFGAFAQRGRDTVATPPALAAALPKGFVALYIKYGHLDDDTTMDALAVMERVLTAADSMANHDRTLFVLLKGPGGYRVAAQSKKVVLCRECGGMEDPFAYGEIEIGNGTFSVYNEGGSAWRWSNTVDFVYDRKDKHWYAKDISSTSFHALDEENTRQDKVKQVGKKGTRVRLEQFRYSE